MSTRNNSLALLAFCALGVFFSYFFYGILQETITKTKYGLLKKNFESIKCMLLVQCVVNAAFAFIALKLKPEGGCSISHKSYALCALSYIGAMFCSNTSLRYVNYPTQVVGKSIKPIPVMLLNVIWARRRYPFKKYIFVGMITVGVMLFMYNRDAAVKGVSQGHGWGEILLLASLSLDGLTGAMQEKFRSQTDVGPYTMMLNLNLWSILYLCTAIFATNEIWHFGSFVHQFPGVLGNILLFGIVSAIGQMFIYTTIVNFGSLMCSVVTTTRKFFTVLASLVLFGHVMSPQQMVGTALVFIGLMADQVFGKTRSARSPPTTTVFAETTSSSTSRVTRQASGVGETKKRK